MPVPKNTNQSKLKDTIFQQSNNTQVKMSKKYDKGQLELTQIHISTKAPTKK